MRLFSCFEMYQSELVLFFKVDSEQPIMKRTIVFIHGMFQNDRSWKNWVEYFNDNGFNCIAPAWPLHGGEPAYLRKHVPAGLGDLVLDDVVIAMETVVTALPEKPIVIGHSVGGLVAQLLVSQGMVDVGVAICPVAPNRMLSLDWGFFKNSMGIANPFKGDEPFYMTPDGFLESFANTMDREASDAAYEATAIHDSRNVLRSCLGASGHIDVSMPHVPLLFIAGEKDNIIPADLVEKNCKAYTDSICITAYKEFANRGHFICGEPDWKEVAEYVHDWVSRHSATDYK